MVREDPTKVQKEVQEQEDETYGTDYTEGVHEKFGDTEEVLEETIGNKPKKKIPFILADEVEEDEKAHAEIPPEDHSNEEEIGEE